MKPKLDRRQADDRPDGGAPWCAVLAAALAGLMLAGCTPGGKFATAPSADDRSSLALATQQALETSRTGEGLNWRNQATGRRGTVTPLRTWSAGDGRPCREFQQTLTGAFGSRVTFGTACRTPAGRWRIVRLARRHDPWRYGGDAYGPYPYGRHLWPYHLYGHHRLFGHHRSYGTGVHIGFSFSTVL